MKKLGITNSVNLRITDAEKDKIKKQAKARGLSISDYLRRIIMTALENDERAAQQKPKERQ